MTVLRILLREIWFRKAHFALSLCAVTMAAALFVIAPTLIDGYSRHTMVRLAALRAEIDAQVKKLEDETRKKMKGMGFNLMIVHRDTNMADFWSSDFSTVDMPQEYIDRLANARELTLVTHLVATLQSKVKWEGRSVLLVGYLPEATQWHRGRKAPMGYTIQPGTVFLGHELGHGRKPGGEVEVLGETFRIARILPEKGSKEDITIAMALGDAQRLLGKPGRVNQILALECRCAGDRLPKIRKQLEAVLPETKVTEFQSIALARAEQRDLVARTGEEQIQTVKEHAAEVRSTMELLAGVTVPVVVVACAVWLGLLALANVRERRVEIGVMRALGVGSLRVGALFIGKAVLLGLIGGAIGLLIGSALAGALGTRAFSADAALFRPSLELLGWTLAGAPLVSAMASYLPTLTAVLQDPAVILRED